MLRCMNEEGETNLNDQNHLTNEKQEVKLNLHIYFKNATSGQAESRNDTEQNGKRYTQTAKSAKKREIQWEMRIRWRKEERD